MPRIEQVNLERVPEAVKLTVAEHLVRGYRLTNEKRTLLHNLTAFQALEEGSYALDRELQRFVGKRAADFFEYAISAENGCLACSAYFVKLLREAGIEDITSFEFTDQERLLIEYGRAIARDPKGVPDALFDALKAAFSQEALVVITAMGALMVANNCFNDVLQVEPEGI